MTTRPIIVVDIETSGLDKFGHDILEVAWVNLEDPDDYGKFVPALPDTWLESADLEALAVNRFIERRGWQHEMNREDTDEEWRAFAATLNDAIFAGVNPHFDAQFITRDLAHYAQKPTWHYRLLDLGAYAAGALELDPHEVPSSADIFKMLDIENTDPHSALGDALATAEAFRKLQTPKGVAG